MEPKQSGTDEPLNSGRSSWAFPVLLLVMLLILVGVAKWVAPPQPVADPLGATRADWTPTPLPTGETVSLEIDFGNGAKKQFTALPWQAEMTVADLLQTVSNFQPSVEFVQQGSGEMGFLTSLDGLANEGAGGRNWIYQVNGEHAHQSFCLEKLEPGMHVLWTFTDELYNGEAAEK